MWLRGIPDISIHRITRAYFSNDFYTAKKYALLTLLLCTTLLFFVMGFYMSFKVAIFDFWVGENFLFSKYFDFALFLMLFANIFQHMAGTFLLSIGGHFELMKTISYYTMIATLLCLILLSAYSFSIDKIVVVLSIVYSIASLVYFYHLFEELWQKR